MGDAKRRILDEIIQKASRAKYNDVAPFLLRAKVVCQSPEDGRQRNEREFESERRGGKRLIWQSDVIGLLADSLTRDYLKVENDWMCAAELCQFLVSCCTASEGLTHDPEFRRGILEKTADGLWQLLYNIHQRVDWGLDDVAINRASVAYQKVCSSCYEFFLECPELITEVWQNRSVMSVLEEKTDRSLDWMLLDLCAKLAKLNPTSVFNLPAARRWRITDSIVDRLRRTADSKSANASIQFLIAWLDAYPLLLSSLTARHGDSFQLSKWRGHGFDSHIALLGNYLSTGFVSDRNSQAVHEAAVRIQAAFRGYATRRRVATMKAGFIKLQHLFRIRRRRAEQGISAEEKVFDIRYQDRIKRYRNDRRYLEKKFQTVSCIHASLVDQYLESEADRAATMIQATWRGYKIRKGHNQRLLVAKLDRAARIIQRIMRKWCEKRRSNKNRLKGWPGLTESRREELQSIIDRYQERHQTSRLPSKQAQKELHDKGQVLLSDHYKRYYSDLNSYQKREATLARIRMHIQTLENAPKLPQSTERHLVMFSARDTAIANRAAYAHREELRFQRLPKWRQLLERASDESKELGHSLKISWRSSFSRTRTDVTIAAGRGLALMDRVSFTSYVTGLVQALELNSPDKA